MKKLFVAIVACAMLASCGSKPATEEQTEETVVTEEVAAPAEEVVEAAPAAEEVAAPAVDEKLTLIDMYVKACEEENEMEATRIAKRIDAEYKDQLSSDDIARMTDASAVLAEKRAEQGKEVAGKVGDALNKLKKD